MERFVMVKISIIIPVYNAEKYLHKCVNSCLSQTLKDIEIIIIDDASTDFTPTVIQKLSEIDNRIKPIFLEENNRQGNARNVGISNSNGKYIMFVDADDWIEPDACEKLYNLSNDADMCGADMFINTNQDELKKNYRYSSTGMCSISQRDDYIRNCGLFTSRIYKKVFLTQNNIYFPVNLYYEDSYFNTLCALYFNSVVKINYNFYHYYQREDSASHGKSEQQYDKITMAQLIYDECNKRGLTEKFPDLVEWKYLFSMAASALYICLPYGFSTQNIEQINRIKTLIKNSIPNYKNKFFILDGSMQFCLKTLFISPILAVLCYKLKIYHYSFAIKSKVKQIFDKTFCVRKKANG